MSAGLGEFSPALAGRAGEPLPLAFDLVPIYVLSFTSRFPGVTHTGARLPPYEFEKFMRRRWLPPQLRWFRSELQPQSLKRAQRSGTGPPSSSRALLPQAARASFRSSNSAWLANRLVLPIGRPKLSRPTTCRLIGASEGAPNALKMLPWRKPRSSFRIFQPISGGFPCPSFAARFFAFFPLSY